MPELICTNVCRLDELPEASKEAARAWYRQGGFDDAWYEAVYEDFRRIADILGIQFKTRALRLVGGSTRQEPCIWFRGFWSQGDGACWAGFYGYRKRAAVEIRAYAPEDDDLHRIADRLQAVQRRNFYQLRAEVTHRGPDDHEYSMAISVERDSLGGQDLFGEAEDVVVEALRDLARWLYRQLEREYAYLTSDAVVDEAILANGYTFTEAGQRFG